MNKPKLIFQKTDDCGEFINKPEYKTTKAAAFDLQSNQNTVVQPKSRAIIKTGLRALIPDGYKLEFKSRSGLSAKQGVEKGAGLIDEDFRNELIIILYNHSNEPFPICEGDRIIQAELVEYIQADIEWGEVPEFDEASNRNGGLGSTGVK